MAHIYRRYPPHRPQATTLDSEGTPDGLEVHISLAARDVSPEAFIKAFEGLTEEFGVKGPVEHDIHRHNLQ
jgi:hypothetical protein